VNPAAKAVLVPPRPNPGPEPLPQRFMTGELILVVLLLVVGTLSLLGRLRLRDRRRVPGAVRRTPQETFDSRRDQMTAWSAAVREALAVRFGASFIARTTEEIASDTILAETLGPEPWARLVLFLSEADRAKFDDREGRQPPLPCESLNWLAEFLVTPKEQPAGTVGPMLQRNRSPCHAAVNRRD
jgi:hypothetical protein